MCKGKTLKCQAMTVTPSRAAPTLHYRSGQLAGKTAPLPDVRYEYSCGCGADVEVTVPADKDPDAALGHYATQGTVPAYASMSVSRTLPQGFAFGGRVAGAGGGGHLAGPSIYGSSWSFSILNGDADPEPEPHGPGPELRRFDGSFIGYRAWKLSGWELVGTGGVSMDPWKPGTNEAVCEGNYFGSGRGSHRAPADGCHCGLYALARFDDPSGWWRQADVLGAVEAWADEDDDNHDRFFIHGTGFRAQYAKIILLAVDDAYPRAKNAAIRALAAEHGADVCKREHLQAAAGEHGQLVPDELLEWAAEGEPPDGLTQLARVSQNLAAQQAAFGVSSKKAMDAMLAMIKAAYPTTAASAVAHPTVPKGRKGVKQTIGTPGPPSFHQVTKPVKKGDRVADAKGDVWQCVRGGRGAQWALEV